MAKPYKPQTPQLLLILKIFVATVVWIIGIYLLASFADGSPETWKHTFAICSGIVWSIGLILIFIIILDREMETEA